MVIFLLKSGACLTIFLMFYKLLLENERMHTFKRFYLLTALLFSLVIPSITFTEYVEVTPVPTTVIAPVETITADDNMPITTESIGPPISQTSFNHWSVVLWTVYGLGVLLFSLKFLFNLWKITRNIRNNPKLEIDKIINVLLRDAVVPHTFFNYIFLNREKFEAHQIPKDVLVHETTHARQKHSFDVLFVELLQIVFWFNPLLHFAKKSIKLNHEFLADEAVLHQGSATTDYQNILLAFASSANYKDHQPSMANAINYSSYSSIKKRFKVMKTQTSKKSILVRSILILPLFALLLYGFRGTKIIERQRTQVKVPNQEGKMIPQINENQKASKISQKRPTSTDFKKWSNRSDFAIWIHGKPVDNSALNNYKPSDFDDYFLSFVYKNARSERYPQAYQLHLYTQEEIEKNAENDGIITIHVNKKGQLLVQYELVELENLASFLSKMNSQLSKEGRKKVVRAKIIPDISAPKTVITKVDLILTDYGLAQIDVLEGEVPYLDSAQKGSTKEQLSEYNRLAEEYNAALKQKRVIPAGDLKSLETIYRKMSEEQKADAQPFPECPDPKASDSEKSDLKESVPKKSLQEGATKKQVGEYNGLAKTYNGMLAEKGNIRIKKSDVDRLKYLQGIMTEDQRTDAEPFPDFPEPPEPPEPPTPAAAPNERMVEVNAQVNEQVVQEIIENQDIYDEVGNISLKSNIQERKHIANRFYAPTPPNPPIPKTPLDFIKEMTKKNARFYYEGEEIDSDKAIEVMKKNPNIKINAHGENGKKPVVKLSTEPIVIDR